MRLIGISPEVLVGSGRTRARRKGVRLAKPRLLVHDGPCATGSDCQAATHAVVDSIPVLRRRLSPCPASWYSIEAPSLLGPGPSMVTGAWVRVGCG